MSWTSILMLIVMVVYLCSVIMIGFQFSKSSTAGEFYLGGRKLGPLVTAMSAEASDMSSWLLMGLPGVAYLTGICDAGWTAIGLAIGTYLNWLLVAERLRCYSQHIHQFTIPGFLAKRFGDERHILQLLAAGIIVIFFVPYTASGFSACGKLFSTLFGIDYHFALLVSAVVIVVYTMLGGFLAASITDFIQSIIMTIALVVVLLYGVSAAGGFDAVWENARSMDGYLSLHLVHDAVTGSAHPYGILPTISIISWGLGYFGMPHILLRFMAIEDRKKLKISRRVASVWVVIAMGVAILIGIIGNAMSANGAILSLEDSETIIVKIAELLSHAGFVPTILGGLILAGMLASTMSTADSQLLAASSSVSEDILKGVFHLQITPKKNVLLARITLLIIGIIGIFIAWDSNSSVFGIVSFAWAGFGASFAPAILVSLFWKKANYKGILAGMCSGGLMVFLWKYLIGAQIEACGKIYELLPAFIVSLCFIILVSLLTGEPDKAVQDCFDSYQDQMK